MAGQGSRIKDTLTESAPALYYNYPPWLWPEKRNYPWPYPDEITEFPPFTPPPFSSYWYRNAAWKDIETKTGLFADGIDRLYLKFRGGGYSDFIDQNWYMNYGDPYLRIAIPNGGDIKSVGLDGHYLNDRFEYIPYQGSTGFGSIGFSGFRSRFSLDDSDFLVGLTTVFADSSITPSVPNDLNAWADHPQVDKIYGICYTSIVYRALWNNTVLAIILNQYYCKESGFFGSTSDGFPYSLQGPGPQWYEGWYSGGKLTSGTAGFDPESPVFINMYLQKNKMRIKISNAITGTVNFTDYPITYSNHYATTAGTYCWVPNDHNYYGGLFHIENRYGITNTGWKVGSI